MPSWTINTTCHWLPSNELGGVVVVVDALGAWQLVCGLIIVMVTLLIITCNVLLLLVLNSSYYAPYLHAQTRCLLTSLAINDLATGILITALSVYPAFTYCWPYGELFCQVQALLRGSLNQHTSILLLLMAVDRYFCQRHPISYQRFCGRKTSLFVIVLSWVASFALYLTLLLPQGSYYFNSYGLMACEPFHQARGVALISTCLLYFPTTMALMYVYGTLFHAQSKSKSSSVCHLPSLGNGSVRLNVKCCQNMCEKAIHVQTTRTMASMSLAFIILVTPWMIKQVVASSVSSEIPAAVDFPVTWLALSTSIMNPFLYWVLNPKFRVAASNYFQMRCAQSTMSDIPPAPPRPTNGRLVQHRSCRRQGDFCPSTTLDDIPPFPPSGAQQQQYGSQKRPTTNHLGRWDSLRRALPSNDPNSSTVPRSTSSHELLSLGHDTERLWGDILERTMSSTSLQHLQQHKIYKNGTASHTCTTQLSQWDNLP